jgi:hypothetical protein
MGQADAQYDDGLPLVLLFEGISLPQQYPSSPLTLVLHRPSFPSSSEN